MLSPEPQIGIHDGKFWVLDGDVIHVSHQVAARTLSSPDARKRPMERQQRAQSLLEYSLILVLIAVVVIGVRLIMGREIKNISISIAGALRQGG